ncbi:hypothetical protein Goklo_008636, partial [Gossypium klotzschianum]|nr:hypothetical protein [Gossypium klotzschianum]
KEIEDIRLIVLNLAPSSKEFFVIPVESNSLQMDLVPQGSLAMSFLPQKGLGLFFSANIQYVDSRWEIPIMLPLHDCPAHELNALCSLDGLKIVEFLNGLCSSIGHVRFAYGL